MTAVWGWTLIGGMSAGLFLLLLCINAVMTWLDRLPARQPGPRNAPRTRDPLYRPAAGEEPER